MHVIDSNCSSLQLYQFSIFSTSFPSFLGGGSHLQGDPNSRGVPILGGTISRGVPSLGGPNPGGSHLWGVPIWGVPSLGDPNSGGVPSLEGGTHVTYPSMHCRCYLSAVQPANGLSSFQLLLI